MTCTQMLERLIEADPDALAGRGRSDVAVHVRECARCRAVADQLLADTRVLAGAVESGAMVRRLRPAPIVLALAAAAVLAFVMLPNRPAAPTTVAAAVVTRVEMSPSAEPANAGTPREARAERREPRAGPANAGTPREPRTAPALGRPYPPAIPVTVRPMQLTPTDISSDQVAVTPPPGKRAAVMRTSDPTITVVWVY